LDRSPEQLDAFLVEARERFDVAERALGDIHREAMIDKEFLVGKQWDPMSKEVREQENRPILTLNLILKFVHQLGNEQRQQRSSLQVSPVGNALTDGLGAGAKPWQTDPRDAADIWQGLMRHIELRSDADTADATAFDNAVGCSIGWEEIDTEYASFESLDQEIRIKRVLDPFAIFWDPSALEPDLSDMQWAFVRQTLSKEQFKKLYPGSPIITNNFFQDFPQLSPGSQWIDNDNVYIVKYWKVSYKKRRLVAYSAPYDADTITSLADAFGEKFSIAERDEEKNLIYFTLFEDQIQEGKTLPKGVQEENDRTVDWPEVTWHKMTGVEVLEEGTWDGIYIPLVPVFGEEQIVNGRKMLFSITRFLRDPQRLYNFFRSQQAEVIALSPKPPFIGAVGQFKTKMQDWQKANLKNFTFLEYDPVPVGNSMAPPPQRNSSEPPIQAVNTACAQSSNEMMEVSGIYPPALGQPSNETSGRAIFARQNESNNANFHFFDNFRRAKRHVGRILMDLIPHIYDRRNRIVRIVKPDDTQEMILINGPTTYKGKPAFFDPEVGQYDLSVQVGPSYQTALQQTFEMLTQMVQADPTLIQVIGDLILRSAPLPGHIGIEAATRLRAVLDPRVQATITSDTPVDPKILSQLAQQGQMIQGLQALVQKYQQILGTKAMEIASKEKIATETNITKLASAELLSKSQIASTLAGHDVEIIKAVLDRHIAEEDRKAQILQAIISAQSGPQDQGQPPAA
jgi:hypothetical protein